MSVRVCRCVGVSVCECVSTSECVSIPMARRGDVERHSDDQHVEGDEVDVHCEASVAREAVVAGGDDVPVVHHEQVEEREQRVTVRVEVEREVPRQGTLHGVA